MRLKDLPLATKIFMLVTVTLILNLCVEGWALYKERETLMHGKQEEAAAIVQATSTIVAEFGRQAQVGEITEAEAKSKALAVVRSLRYNTSEYVWINDLQHVVLMHPIKPALEGKDQSGLKDPEGTFVFRRFVEVAKADGAGFVHYMWPKPGFDNPVAKTSYVQLYRPWGWVIGSGLYLDDVERKFDGILLATSLGILAVVTLTFGLAWLFVRGAVKPLTASVAAVQRLADEDLTVEAGDQQRRDEIGDLSRAIAAFRTKLAERQALAQREATELAEKERRQEASQRLIQEFSTTMSGVLSELSDASSEMSVTADTVNRSATTTTDQAVTVSAAAEQASVNVQTVSAAAQELAASIEEVTRQVGQSSQVTSEAQQQAASTVNTVERLRTAAGQINEVVELISSIAAQTNLLALNATIEAARAGDAGKGFAVVAGEVKGLATQTAKATEDIARQISEMQQVSDEATQAIAVIVDTIERIGAISTSVAAAMDEQNAATHEIVRSVEEVASGTSMVAESIDSVRAAAVDSREAAGSVSSTAIQLSEQTATLREEITGFLGEISSAGERRNYDRTDCDLEAVVEAAGTRVSGRVANIGLGGALFQGRVVGNAGARVTLVLGEHRISAQLIESGERTRLRFLLDAANRNAVEALLARPAA